MGFQRAICSKCFKHRSIQKRLLSTVVSGELNKSTNEFQLIRYHFSTRPTFDAIANFA